MNSRLVRILAVLIVGGIIGTVSLPFSAVEGMPLAGVTVAPKTLNDDFDPAADFDGICSLREALYTVMSNTDYGGCTHTGTGDKDKILLDEGILQTTITGNEDEAKPETWIFTLSKPVHLPIE